MSKKQQVVEIPPRSVLLVNICSTGCIKQINKLFEKIDRKHATHTTIAPQLDQGKALVIVTGNIDTAILFKKLKTINKIPKLIEPVHEDKGSSSNSTDVKPPNPSNNNNDNKDVAPVIEKKPKKNEGSEKKEEKNKGKEIEERKNKGQEEQRAPVGAMHNHLPGPMGGETTYGPEEATMHGRFGYPPPRQHYSSIFDEENPNGCSFMWNF